jgi:hypothetical protein
MKKIKLISIGILGIISIYLVCFILFNLRIEGNYHSSFFCMDGADIKLQNKKIYIYNWHQEILADGSKIGEYEKLPNGNYSIKIEYKEDNKKKEYSFECKRTISGFKSIKRLNENYFSNYVFFKDDIVHIVLMLIFDRKKSELIGAGNLAPLDARP